MRHAAFACYTLALGIAVGVSGNYLWHLRSHCRQLSETVAQQDERLIYLAREIWQLHSADGQLKKQIRELPRCVHPEPLTPHWVQPFQRHDEFYIFRKIQDESTATLLARQRGARENDHQDF